jgi:hypothetical protein
MKTTPPTEQIKKIEKHNFIEAVISIGKRKDLEFCGDPSEMDGSYKSICVYKNGSFIGKLRWPTEKTCATVDEELLKEINEN